MQYAYRKQMQTLRLKKGNRKDEKYNSHRGKGIPERLYIQFDKIYSVNSPNILKTELYVYMIIFKMHLNFE